ncbi:MAG: hypothetical protein K2X38_06370 [Gemmataceae bacterium]|nr:hypothetical protein [Gemmataceae bacterium]
MASESSHINKPKPDAKLARWGYFMKLQFHPEIRLERKKGFEFAQRLMSFFDPQTTDFKSERWLFKQPIGSSPDSYLSITVSQRDLQMHCSFPETGMELYENKYQKLLEVFGEFFQPELILSSSAMVRGSMAIDGDSRVFLASDVMKIDGERTKEFGRPIHLVGLRLFFPPFKKKGQGKKSQTEWQVDVKVESLLEDPSQLFLEADADWSMPRDWNNDALAEEVQRLGIVQAFLNENILKFLQFNSAANGPSQREDETPDEEN